MIRFFRSSFLIQYIAAFALGVMLWMPAMLKAVPASPAFDNEPLYKLLLIIPFTSLPLLSVLSAFVLMLVSGYLLNAILSLFLLTPRTSTYGLLFWVVVSGSFPAAMSFQPLWPALLLLLFALNLAFSMYEQESINFKLFNFGMLTAFSGMMHGGAWVFVLWVLSILFILRLNRLREWLIPFLGFFVPIIYLLVVWFLQNRVVTNLGHFLFAFAEGFSVPQLPSPTQIGIFVFLIALFFKALTFNYSLQADRNIAVRKRKAMLNAFLLIAILAFIVRDDSLQSNALVIIPLSAHLAIWAGSLNRTARPSVVVWLFVLLSAVNNFLFFFGHAQGTLR